MPGRLPYSMGLARSTANELRAAGVHLDEHFPLARRTWWRVGGPADGFAKLTSLPQLRAAQRICHDTGTPVFVLGNGSNLLVSDRGIRGLVVQLEGELATWRETDDRVLQVGGGARLVRFVRSAEKHGWTGMEVFAGIPGTMGGAVRMNAGASLGETCDVLLDAQIVLKTGDMATRTRDELNMTYRSTDLPPGAIVASTRLQCTSADAGATFARMHTFLDRRKATQPVDKPSCGSTFRNPPGDHAGRLIEAAGLKGYTRGGAQIAHKHANFVLNLGDATADDLRHTIEHAAATVERQFGVRLHREVHFVGDWNHWPHPTLEQGGEA